MTYNIINYGTHLGIRWAPSLGAINEVKLPKKDITLTMLANSILINSPDVGPGKEQFELTLSSTVAGNTAPTIPVLYFWISSALLTTGPDWVYPLSGTVLINCYKIDDRQWAPDPENPEEFVTGYYLMEYIETSDSPFKLSYWIYGHPDYYGYPDTNYGYFYPSHEF